MPPPGNATLQRGTVLVREVLVPLVSQAGAWRSQAGGAPLCTIAPLDSIPRGGTSPFRRQGLCRPGGGPAGCGRLPRALREGSVTERSRRSREQGAAVGAGLVSAPRRRNAAHGAFADASGTACRTTPPGSTPRTPRTGESPHLRFPFLLDGSASMSEALPGWGSDLGDGYGSRQGGLRLSTVVVGQPSTAGGSRALSAAAAHALAAISERTSSSVMMPTTSKASSVTRTSGEPVTRIRGMTWSTGMWVGTYWGGRM